MATAVGSITRAATRDPNGPLNILSYPTHERAQSWMTDCNAMFYLYQGPGIKPWTSQYAPLPKNHILLNPAKGTAQIPPEVDFDLILAQSIGQFGISKQLVTQLHLPLIRLEHTLPVPSWGAARIQKLRQLSGDINVFISEFSRAAWGFDETHRVIHHGLDTETFSPGGFADPREQVALSVVNDWINRDIFCGYRFWAEATKGATTVVVGDTPGLSKPAESVQDLVEHYRRSQLFVNTSLISPVPTALLEAMACGCAVVSTDTAMIPEVIESGVNGVLCSTPEQMRGEVKRLLSDPDECRRLGENARQTIVERFTIDRFVKEWDMIFREASQIVFRGE